LCGAIAGSHGVASVTECLHLPETPSFDFLTLTTAFELSLSASHDSRTTSSGGMACHSFLTPTQYLLLHGLKRSLL
jgi:hypothetical protein